jgi:microcystin-dependent protein
MSVPLTVGGVTFQYPQEFDKHWGPTLTNWATAVTNVLATVTAGTFVVLKSTASNIAQSGLIRFANASTGLGFRNFLNNADLLLTVNASNQLTFNGVPIGATASLTDGHIYVGNVTNNPTDVAMTGDITISNTGVTTLGALKVTDSQISATAAIALSKLASTTAYYWYAANATGVLTPVGVTASKVIISDSNGLPSASSVSTTTLGYLDATSSVQTQLNTALGYSANLVPAGAMMDFAGTVAPSGWLLCDGSSYATATYPNLYAAIGYNWGGSGANFNVPNFTRRTAVGSGGSGTATLGNAVGNVGGAETHTLTQAELPTAIGTASSSVNDPGHRHNYGLINNNPGTGSVDGISDNAGGTTTNDRAITYLFDTNMAINTTGITVSTSITNPGGSNAHTIMQPSAVVLKIIKT